MTNCTFLHDESIVVEGIKFYGTPWTRNLGEADDNEGYLRDKSGMRKYLDAIPEDVEYLMVHGPPQGILDINGKGSCVLRRNLKRLRNLRVLQCGHVHGGRGHVFITRESIQNSISSVLPPKNEKEDEDGEDYLGKNLKKNTKLNT